jgi:catechol 2,3-dioxygenase-like lactoylglutathione lyase family enzyme
VVASHTHVVFDHMTIRVSDRAASRRFYETVLAPLGYPISYAGDEFDEWRDFGLAQARDDRPRTRNLHVAFVARSREEVDAFWQAGIDAGYTSDGEPGLRPEYHADYYGGFLLDPDRSSSEAVYHGRLRDGDAILDHLWIRVTDLSEARRFYETLASLLGLGIGGTRPERFHVAGNDRSFTLLHGEPPTENVHLALPATDDATVDRFHESMVAAGFRDNGAPGVRPAYAPGYYGAFVLDPAGNNVEAVHHHRRPT